MGCAGCGGESISPRQLKGEAGNTDPPAGFQAVEQLVPLTMLTWEWWASSVKLKQLQ